MNYENCLLEIEYDYNTTMDENQVRLLQHYTGKEVKLQGRKLDYSSQDHQLTLVEALTIGVPFKVIKATKLARWTGEPLNSPFLPTTPSVPKELPFDDDAPLRVPPSSDDVPF